MTHEAEKTDALHTIKLYSPLIARTDDEYGNMLIETSVAWAETYEAEIMEAIERDPDYDTPRGLMAYYHGQDSINEKVFSIKPAVEYIHCEVHGVAVLECKAPLTPEEMELVKGYTSGQWADGWGEGFEQCPIKTPDGDLFISFWDSEYSYMRTEDEMQQARQERLKKSRGRMER